MHNVLCSRVETHATCDKAREHATFHAKETHATCHAKQGIKHMLHTKHVMQNLLYHFRGWFKKKTYINA